MSRRFCSIVCAVAVVSFLAGCASNSSFRTAKPLGKNQTEGFVALSGINFSDTASIIDGGYFLELGASVGLTEALDIGLKYTVPTGGNVEAKYTLLGTNQETGLFLAPALRAGYYNLITIGDSKIDRFEFAVPVYLTYAPASIFQITLQPAYTGRVVMTSDEDEVSSSSFQQLVGTNANLKLGKKLGILVEGAYYYDLKSKTTEAQYGFGFLMDMKSLLPSFLQQE